MSGSGLRSAGVRLSVEGASEAEAAFRRVGEAGDQSMGRVSASAQRAATALREVQPAADRAAQSIGQATAPITTLAGAANNAQERMRLLSAATGQAGTALTALGAGPVAGSISALSVGLDAAAAALGRVGASGAAAGVTVSSLATSFLTWGTAIGAVTVGLQAAGLGINAAGRGAQTAADYTTSYRATLEILNSVLQSTEQRAQAAAQALLNVDRARVRDAADTQLGRLFEQRSAAIETVRTTAPQIAALQERISGREARDAGRGFDPAVTARRQDADRAALAALEARRTAAQVDFERLNGEERTINEGRALSEARIYTSPAGPEAPARERATGGGGTARRSQEEIDAERELNRIRSESAAILRANEAPYDTYLRQLRELGDLQETLARRGEPQLTDDQVQATSERFLRTLEDAERQTAAIGNTGKLVGSALTNAFDAAINRGEKLSVVFRSLSEDLAKIVLQKGITEPLGNAFSAAATSAGPALGSFFSGLFSANGNAFSGGDLIPFANGGVFDSPTVFPMSRGRFGVMGEAGPEAVMPLERGPGGRLGVRASGGGGGVTQVINIDARNADSGVDQKIRAAITIATQQANAQLLADISRGGSTAKQVGRRG
jgi:hypothetical protein